MPGCVAALDVLKPIAMSPEPSSAALGIHRYVESGAYVPCWKIVGVVPGERISYQRMPIEVPAVTEWLTTSDSWSPKLRYPSRYMSRSPSESSCCVVPACGTHVPPAHAGANGATGIWAAAVIVVFAVFAQSTWNFQKSSAFVEKSTR